MGAERDVAYSPRGRPTCRGTFGGVFFFYLRLLRRCRGIFFLLSLFFFFNIFCCFVCLICVCEGYTWKVSSSCHQKLEPMFGEEGRAIHAVHGMAPRLQQQHFNNSNSFL